MDEQGNASVAPPDDEHGLVYNISDFNLSGLSRNNILLGKNGCGKSYFLKEAEKAFRNLPELGSVRYKPGARRTSSISARD
jgi:ABC-type cobalamin/Fe3+-siderophores transport system ATPase subunit